MSRQNISECICLFLCLSLLSCKEPPPTLANPNDPSSNQYIPAPPTGLAIQASSDTVARISWIDNSSSEDGFIVERTSHAASFVQLAIVGRDTTSYVDRSPRITDTTYQYRVCAFKSNHKSVYAYINYAYGFPAPQVNGDRTEPDSSVTIFWRGLSSLAVSVNVERSLDGTSFTSIAIVPASNFAFNDKFVVKTTDYSYRLRAVGLHNSSPYSSLVTVRWLVDSVAQIASFNAGYLGIARPYASEFGRTIAIWFSQYFYTIDTQSSSMWQPPSSLFFESDSNGTGSKPVGAVVLSPDGSHLVVNFIGGLSSMSRGRLSMYDIGDTVNVWLATSSNYFDLGLGWTPDGNEVVGGTNGNLECYSAIDGSKVKELTVGPQWHFYALSRNGQIALMTTDFLDAFMTVNILDGNPGITIHPTSTVSSAAINDNGSKIVLNYGTQLGLYESQTGQILMQFGSPSSESFTGVFVGGLFDHIVGLTSLGQAMIWSGNKYELTKQWRVGYLSLSGSLYAGGAKLAVLSEGLPIYEIIERWAIR